MPENTLAKKMRLKPDLRAVVINAPDGYLKELTPLPSGVEVLEAMRGKFDWMQVFFKTKAEVDKLFPKILRALKPDGLVWLTFPKGTSKIQTDLTRDKGWDALQQADLKWVTLISVNATWSAFAMRPYKSGEARQTFR